jgi:SAM-dependent methyltransferase
MPEKLRFKSRFQLVQNLFRKTHVLFLAEYCDYVVSRLRCRSRNAIFLTQYPDFKIPPEYLAYDAYSAPDWEFYKESGEESAAYLKSTISEFNSGGEVDSVLEWGCGPGRIIRHLPKIFGPQVAIYGSDYNSKSIEWCRESIPGVVFIENGLNPPLQLESNHFDYIYAVSVFTHLSEATGIAWIDELHRLLKPSGILLITLKGESYYQQLLPKEKKIFDLRGIVVRGDVTEGKKMFATFTKPDYVRNKMLSRFNVLQHIINGSPLSNQDIWIARKI